MSKFYQRAVDKLTKMDEVQVRSLFQSLTAENDLLAIVLDSMASGVMVTDTKGRVLLVNRAAERQVPMLAGDHRERLAWEIITDREIAAFIRATLLQEESADERDFTTESGAARTLTFAVLPLVRDRQIAGNLIHIDDVTDKRSRDARLRRAESLAALTTLTAGVAHEIKNPLGAIGIHLQLMQRRLRNEAAELGGDDLVALREAVAVIEEEVERLNRIVVDYLFAVRPINTTMESGDVNDVLTELLRFMAPELDAAGIELHAELAADLPPVLIDERYLREALLNIIKNAMVAMQEQDAAQPRQLTVASSTDGENLHISITDTGPGIPEEIQGKIFEPYFTTRDFGSGLGLTLVYKIVKEHLGEVALDSRPGEGSTFSVIIPIPQAEQRLIGYEEAVR